MKPSLRFSILARDGYTCRYCGRHPPDVLLEVDHVLPLSAGGADEEGNLVASCRDCNRGKAARLASGWPGALPESADELAARIDQGKEYLRQLGEVEALKQRAVDTVLDAWRAAFHFTKRRKRPVPDVSSLRLFLSKLPIDEVLDAVHLAAAKFNDRNLDENAVRYFYGVCHHKLRGSDGRPGGGRRRW